MDRIAIRKKFGDDYTADENTFIMGSDHRFTSHFAERFRGLHVLETCTGAGFTTIPLAKSARHIFTVEINLSHQRQAIANLKKAGLQDCVTFIHGSALDESVLGAIPKVEAAFIDPDWSVTGPDHQFRFINSNTQPPADVLFSRIYKITKNIAMVLPPFIDTYEFRELPKHELESLYLDGRHELFCLYFGKLMNIEGESLFRVGD